MSELTFLVAEDDPHHQKILHLNLTRTHPETRVVTVASGEDLLRTLRESGGSSFDCVIMDFNLPDCHAAELLARMEAKKCPFPILIISSSEQQNIVAESMRLGGVDFLPKTDAFQGNELWNRCLKAIGQKKASRRQQRRATLRIRHLSQLAETDPLTGLRNRAAFDRLIHSNGRRVFDQRGSVSLILLDIDHFKNINDTFGHLCGDAVLRAVAELLQASAFDVDMVCRWGGEEFLIVKPYTNISRAQFWVEMLRKKIDRLSVFFNEHRINITASFGVASVPSEQINADVLRVADQALYLAKRLGRNRICSQEWVYFEEQCQKAECSLPRTPEEKYQLIVELAREHLGPLQYEYITRHSQRVSRLAVQIGASFDLNSDELEQLRRAGLFHDLGTFLVPEQVLAQQGPLAIEDRELLARCTREGAEMSIRLGADQTVAHYIRNHRAFYDHVGNEQRNNLIPLGARIIGLADAFDTMQFSRPHQPARSTTAALSELRRASGTQFDPAVVNVLSEKFQRRELDIGDEEERLHTSSARGITVNVPLDSPISSPSKFSAARG